MASLDNVMTLSLLKSAKYPDTEADMGIHTFTYALLPHADALGMETIEEGIRLNQPMQLTGQAEWIRKPLRGFL